VIGVAFARELHVIGRTNLQRGLAAAAVHCFHAAAIEYAPPGNLVPYVLRAHGSDSRQAERGPVAIFGSAAACPVHPRGSRRVLLTY
jgi:hypothetical protein